MTVSNVPGLPGGSVLVDEIGIETGRYGSFHLKTAYQPIYAVAGDVLAPHGVEGFVQPLIDFEPVEPATFFSIVEPEKLGPVRSLCRSLHMGNYHHLGIEGLMLHLNCEAGKPGERGDAFAQMDFLAERAGEVELDPRLVVCGFIARDVLEDDVPDSLARAMRAAGFRLAVDDFGPGHSVLDRIQRIRPEVVKIDGGWFRRIAGFESAVRLLTKLIAGLKGDGAAVLIRGIETQAQLNVALSVGADFVQGYLLGRPVRAGTVFDPQAVEISQFFRDPEKVIIPLR
ncbi:diguanylate phosphodiesterase [Nitratireductor indicus C115]|uniref:Diguanylate phosphodiesterase n=1 Tax=Nitratireductor indicus C115 TaxID=1231190 RepID=K2PR61_9HYPH|nr:EAL domain-containing protein [Nitratireductor indicus]EKF43522.1 diguanylate phosphodiesterase [Nitratireductor indicus C115]SFQ05824.1 EAL domain, c-di-GMP-specific phosphodiesterase class I (or its enzymatically inactive variant) [Nitratireductor indicus]